MKEGTLNKHTITCEKFPVQRVIMPEAHKKYISFSSFRKMVKFPLYIGELLWMMMISMMTVMS